MNNYNHNHGLYQGRGADNLKPAVISADREMNEEGDEANWLDHVAGNAGSYMVLAVAIAAVVMCAIVAMHWFG